MFNFLYKILTISLIFLCIVGCASKNKDFVPDKQPKELYEEAYKALSVENYDLARQYLEAISSRYPFGPYAYQVQLELIYTYYKSRENELALAEIDSFLRLNPSDENVDYVLYIRGLTNMQRSTDRVLNIIRIKTYDRDISILSQAFQDFKKLVQNYPNSLYVADAFARMVFIKNSIAKHEYEIAKFYHNKQAYISSARRCQRIISNFKDTEVLEGTLKILEDDYRQLKLFNMADNIQKLRILNFN
ncbi:MAG: outer membrane protein assembly factor BamD [Succinivibrionaceae bacterium]